VILLHGITDSWRSFEPLLPHLSRSVNAFALTLRGHGGSDKPTGDYTISLLARDVGAFMTAAGVPSAIIVGHSMSTVVALRLAIDSPAQTRGLVLIGGSANWRDNALAQELSVAFGRLRDPLDPAFVREFQASTVATPVPAIIDIATRESLRVPARVWKAAMAGLQETDLTNELGSIRVPTLLMWGDQETVVTRAEQYTMVRHIRGSRLLVLDGVGHAAHWDAPARVAGALGAFFTDVSQLRHPHVQVPRHTPGHDARETHAP
jgi:pimeloyl-ACP methyl ester carboxylesterase